MEWVERRIVIAALITWLPLAFLTIIQGGFIGGVSVPFLYDLDVHIRFLLSLPLLIAAEVIVHQRLRSIVYQFPEHKLIRPEDQRTFDSIISSAMRLRNSVLIEILLLVVAFTAGYFVWRSQASLHVATWYGTSNNGIMSFTWAGYWYVFFGVPVLRFLLLRWYFRLFIWYLFLFRVSRLELQLNALHPDRAGGLGFLSQSAYAIAPVLVAQTIFLGGVIANQILYEGARLPDFQMLIGGTAAFLMLIVLLPLGFFAIQMARAKREALREYGSFAAAYVDDFQRKWLTETRSGSGREEELGTGDIQSLADLGNSFAVVQEMRALPLGKEVVMRLLVLIALPLLPLLLTMFPFDVLVKQLVGLVL